MRLTDYTKYIIVAGYRLHLFEKMDDKRYLKFLYLCFLGKKLDIDNPKTFNEKLQWLKLYDRRPEYTTMVDKYEAKKYVSSIIGDEYIIPTLGVYDSFDEIDFDSLPNQFVLKCTHDSGGLVVCTDKSKLDLKSAKNKINKCLKRNYYYQCREWPYKDIKPRIIVEKYMDNNSNDGLIDYKFYCFDGEVKCLYVSQGLEDHSTARISFLTPDWQFAPYKRIDFKGFETLPQKPKHYDKMLEIAQQLSAGHCFLRVDLYETNNQIYFSELTFSPCAGMMPFDNPKWDKIFGDWLTLPYINK